MQNFAIVLVVSVDKLLNKGSDFRWFEIPTWRSYDVTLITNHHWLVNGYPNQKRITNRAPIINSSPPGQNGNHFTDDIFKCIFVNEKFYMSIAIWLKFVPEGPIDDNPALF